MNQPLADRLGVKPLEPLLHQVAGLVEKKQLAAVLAVSPAPARPQGPGTDGSGLMYSFSSDQDHDDSTKVIGELRQGGLSLPDRDFYIMRDPRSEETRTRFTSHVAKMFTLLGDSPEQANAEAQAVMKIETALAKGSMARVDLRDPLRWGRPDCVGCSSRSIMGCRCPGALSQQASIRRYGRGPRVSES